MSLQVRMAVSSCQPPDKPRPFLWALLLPRTIYRPRPSWGLGMGLGLQSSMALPNHNKSQPPISLAWAFAYKAKVLSPRTVSQGHKEGLGGHGPWMPIKANFQYPWHCMGLRLLCQGSPRTMSQGQKEGLAGHGPWILFLFCGFWHGSPPKGVVGGLPSKTRGKTSILHD